VKALVVQPPVAAGPFCPDAFADNGDGRGICWGLSHIVGFGNGFLLRFDCDLHRDVDRSFLKCGTIQADEDSHFQPRTTLPPGWQKRFMQEAISTRDKTANIDLEAKGEGEATVIYRMNPHLDTRERGLETASLMVRTLRGEISPVQWLEMPPMVINILKQHTEEEPCLSLMQDVDEAMARPRILSASLSLSYQYADVAEMGASFLAVADGDLLAARDAARWMARRAWARRAEFVASAPSPEEALEEAASCAGRPVVLMDVGDNVGGGSAADSTILLREALRLGIGDMLIVLKDPESTFAWHRGELAPTAAGPRSQPELIDATPQALRRALDSLRAGPDR